MRFPSVQRSSLCKSKQAAHTCAVRFHLQRLVCGGGKRDRTDDPLLAKQVLYQLSYAPVPTRFLPPEQSGPSVFGGSGRT